MNRAAILKKIERLEHDARILLNTASTLKEELSGGSDSSVLRKNHMQQMVDKRRKRMGQ